MASKPLKPWRYRDFGSLVSLVRHSTVGNLMGGRVGRSRSLWLEGYLAWLRLELRARSPPRPRHSSRVAEK